MKTVLAQRRKDKAHSLDESTYTYSPIRLKYRCQFPSCPRTSLTNGSLKVAVAVYGKHLSSRAHASHPEVYPRLHSSHLLSCAHYLRGGKPAHADAPVLISEPTSTRAIAMDSVTWKREPFPLVQPIPFSLDSRTRVMLFARNLDLLPGEGASAVTAEAEDAHAHALPLDDRVCRPCARL